MTMGITFCAKGSWKEVGCMQTVIDSGLLSGLQAMSEMSEMLDELYGNLA